MPERGMRVGLGAHPRVPSAPMFGNARVQRKMKKGMGKFSMTWEIWRWMCADDSCVLENFEL